MLLPSAFKLPSARLLAASLLLAVPSPSLDLDVLEQTSKLPAKPKLALEQLTLARLGSSSDPHRPAPLERGQRPNATG